MVVRQGLLLVSLSCLSCHALSPVRESPRSVASVAEAAPSKSIVKKAVIQVGHSEQSPLADPVLLEAHLALAVSHLRQGQLAQARPHLAVYVAAHPEHLLLRVRYAELLYRLEQYVEAKKEYQRFVADAQEEGEKFIRQLIQCQGRLMAIAEAEEDRYGEHLHRGIGLFLLACQRSRLPDPEDELSVESLLCKAAGELVLAHAIRTQEAQPCWYLYRVWSQLGQQRQARRWLREAETATPYSYLTPTEQRGLLLACAAWETQRSARLQ